jgi:hypothetical protein
MTKIKVEMEEEQLKYLINILSKLLQRRDDQELRNILDILELELDTGDRR